MKISMILFTCSIFLSSISFAQCGDPANVYTFTSNESTYELIRENLTWEGTSTCAFSSGPKETVEKELPKVHEHFAQAYIKNSEIYVGCRH